MGMRAGSPAEPLPRELPMTELRLTQSTVISASDGRPLILHRVQLLAEGGTARADIEDGHGMPLLGLRAGPAELSPVSGTWKADHPSGRQVSGVGVHLTGQGAVLLVNVEPQADPARDPAHLVVNDIAPRQRTYRNPNPELNDDATRSLRRSHP
jgi:hypothetical protein